MLLGAIVGAPLAVVLLNHVSWKIVFVLYSVPGILWAAGFYWWFRDRIEDHPAANDAEVARVRHTDKTVSAIDATGQTEHVTGQKEEPWLEILIQPTTWTLCAQQFFQAAGFAWLLTWFPTFLQESRGVSREAAGWLTTVPLVTTMVAALFGGRLS